MALPVQVRQHALFAFYLWLLLDRWAPQQHQSLPDHQQHSCYRLALADIHKWESLHIAHRHEHVPVHANAPLYRELLTLQFAAALLLDSAALALKFLLASHLYSVAHLVHHLQQ